MNIKSQSLSQLSSPNLFTFTLHLWISPAILLLRDSFVLTENTHRSFSFQTSYFANFFTLRNFEKAFPKAVLRPFEVIIRSLELPCAEERSLPSFGCMTHALTDGQSSNCAVCWLTDPSLRRLVWSGGKQERMRLRLSRAYHGNDLRFIFNIFHIQFHLDGMITVDSSANGNARD